MSADTAMIEDGEGAHANVSQLVSLNQGLAVATVSAGGNQVGMRGSVTNMLVKITDDAYGLMAADLTITYDTTILDIADSDITASSSLSRWGMDTNASDDTGIIRISLYSTRNAISAHGPLDLLNLAFRVRSDAPAGTSPVTIDTSIDPVTLVPRSRLNEGGMSLSPANGSIAIPIAVTVVPDVNNVYHEGAILRFSSTAAGQSGSVSYLWTVAKNSVPYPVADNTSPVFSFIPDDNASYAVTLAVTDSSSHMGTAEVTSTVLNLPPTATMGSDGTVGEGSPVTVRLSNPQDAQADMSAGLHYAFGLNLGGLAGTYAGASANSEAQFSFTDNGTYTIYGRIFDKDGGYTDYSTQATVRNVSPGNVDLNVVPATIEENGTTFLSGTFTDPGVQDTQTVTIDWGDGNTDVLYLAAGVTAFQNSPHRYLDNLADDAPYTIRVTVEDNDGGATEAFTHVTVANVGPTVTLQGPAAASEGQTMHYTFTTSDPGVDTFSIHDISGGSVGMVSNVIFDSATGAGSFDVTFSDGPATSQVRVQVMDSDHAASNAASVEVSVTNTTPTISVDEDSVSGNEASSIHNSGLYQDAGIDDNVALKASVGTIVDNGDGTWSWSYTPPEIYLTASTTQTVSVTAEDKDGATVASSFLLKIYPRADFNHDDTVNAYDIDLLYANFGSSLAKFDLTDDGSVDQADMDKLVHTILHSQYGDANLDHFVDFLDFQIMLDYWQGESGWAHGNFNGDGMTEFLDFQILLDNWQWEYVEPEIVPMSLLGAGPGPATGESAPASGSGPSSTVQTGSAAAGLLLSQPNGSLIDSLSPDANVLTFGKLNLNAVAGAACEGETVCLTQSAILLAFESEQTTVSSIDDTPFDALEISSALPIGLPGNT